MFSLGEIDTAGRNSHGGHDENAIADICASWGSLIIKVGCAGMAASTCIVPSLMSCFTTSISKSTFPSLILAGTTWWVATLHHVPSWGRGRCMIYQCWRGLLVLETMDDQSIETHSASMATRCINCGCIEDAVMRANRFHRLKSIRAISERCRRMRKGNVMLSKSDTSVWAFSR